MSGFRRFVLVGGMIAAGFGTTELRAQAVLGDPKDAPKVFASTCSACHKSPQGLAKSGQVAGFLRQHYTTGAEMSAAMAAYLVAAGSGPASKKGAAADPADAKVKEAREKAKEAREKAKEAREKRKQDQLAATHPAGDTAGSAAETQKQKRTLRGKQHPIQPQEPETAAPAPPAAEPAAHPVPRQTAVAVQPAPQAAVSPQPGAAAATTGAPGQIELNIPLPPMPDAPPPELSQSAFSSSPLP